jgi:hypothetical protein
VPVGSSAWLGGTVEPKTNMKELLTISSNFMGAWTEDKKLLPQVEVILVLSEPAYTVDAVGEVVRQRETSQCRFSASPKMLYKLADVLTKLGAEAEGLVTPNIVATQPTA